MARQTNQYPDRSDGFRSPIRPRQGSELFSVSSFSEGPSSPGADSSFDGSSGFSMSPSPTTADHPPVGYSMEPFAVPNDPYQHFTPPADLYGMISPQIPVYAPAPQLQTPQYIIPQAPFGFAPYHPAAQTVVTQPLPSSGLDPFASSVAASQSSMLSRSGGHRGGHSQTTTPAPVTSDRAFREQQEKFLSVPTDPGNSNRYGPYIQQKAYRPQTKADQKRYVEDVALDDPIDFYFGSEWGIPLSEAINKGTQGLYGANQRVMLNSGPSVSIRLRVNGFSRWSKQIASRDYCKPQRKPISLAKLSTEVAKVVERYLQDVRSDVPKDGAPIDMRRITIDDLVLVSLHNISKGSWQPQLRLRRPLATAEGLPSRTVR